MKVEQVCWRQSGELQFASPLESPDAAQVVFAFGSPALLRNGISREIRQRYPRAILFGCSTAGEICDTRVTDDTVAVTAVHFAATEVRQSEVRITSADHSYAAGTELARSLKCQDLVHVFVLSDGLHVNGSELVKGLTSELPSGVLVTGGLSADADRFRETLVLTSDGPESCAIAALGFYGSQLTVGCGSLGGWDSFGPERLVTRSTGNVLFELDGRSALDLYKEYLGEHASGLPATALLFPLSMRVSGKNEPVVRTILSIDEAAGSMTFAGDIPQGAYARLMKANFNRLVDGAAGAARVSSQGLNGGAPDLALLISCIGRKLVLKQRIEEEVESVRDVLGSTTALTGFYSYGEISPFTPSATCELHNQTMTITTFSER